MRARSIKYEDEVYCLLSLQDIEDDMRNLRTTATSVLNKYTPTALSHLDPAAKKAERKSR